MFNKEKFEEGQVSIEFVISALVIILFFTLSVAMFNSRLDFVQNSSNQWAAREVAYVLSRNINSLELIDGNFSTSTFIYWNLRGQSVKFLEDKVLVFWQEGSFVDALLYPRNIEWKITDLNGLIYFKKENGRVIVSYD